MHNSLGKVYTDTYYKICPQKHKNKIFLLDSFYSFITAANESYIQALKHKTDKAIISFQY